MPGAETAAPIDAAPPADAPAPPDAVPSAQPARGVGPSPVGGPIPGLADPRLAATPTGLPWSSAAAWGGAAPAPGADVEIPRGRTVVVDGSVTVAGLTVHGTLVCDPSRDSALTARWVIVDGGAFICGTPSAPHGRRFTLTLVGARGDEDVMGMGTKLVGTMNGGRLQLVGPPRVPWAHLGATAAAGASAITLETDTGWRAGEQLVIASTDFDGNQAEARTITAVNGTTLTLDRPLTFMHWGTLQTFANDNPARLTTLDERAEVGLLSRDVLVQGDAASEDDAFGAQVMAMAGGQLYLHGVELFRVGQGRLKARYPAHWHLLGDAPGQFVADSSIHHSFNRCVTLHGTNRLLVRDNTCFDYVGHGFFIEDGIETGNVIEGNLAVAGHRPKAGEALIPSDATADGPASFWITNPDNRVRSNVAAGSEGSSFWYPPLTHPTGPSATTAVTPYKLKPAEFDHNAAHSAPTGLLLAHGDAPTDFFGWAPTDPPLFTRFVAYKIGSAAGGFMGAVWVRAVVGRFRDFVVADTRNSFFNSNDQWVENALIVAESANVGNPRTDAEKKYGRSLPDAGALRDDMPQTGLGLYDGPHHLKNVHFVGFKPGAGPLLGMVMAFGGAFTAPDNTVEAVTSAGGATFLWPRWDTVGGFGDPDPGLVDVDGSLTGKAGMTLTGMSPVGRTAACKPIASKFERDPALTYLFTDHRESPWVAYACPEPLVNLMIDLGGGVTWEDSPLLATATRDDGAFHRTQGHAPHATGKVYWYQWNVVRNRRYDVTFEAPARLPARLTLKLQNGHKGDWVEVSIPWAPATAKVVLDDAAGARPLAAVGSAAAVSVGGAAYFLGGGKLVARLRLESDVVEPGYLHRAATLTVCTTGC